MMTTMGYITSFSQIPTINDSMSFIEDEPAFSSGCPLNHLGPELHEEYLRSIGSFVVPMHHPEWKIHHLMPVEATQWAGRVH